MPRPWRARAPPPFCLSSRPLTRAARRVRAVSLARAQQPCIIVSLAKTSSNGAVGTLLSDWRRLNVALTRAQSKLIVLGSARTMQHAPVPAALFALADARGWAQRMPADAAALGARASEVPSE